MTSSEHSSQPGSQDQSAPGIHRRAQLAAVAALILALGLVWFALSMVANDPVGLVISFAAIFLCVRVYGESEES